MKGNGIPITKGWTLRNEFVCPLITLESPAFRRGECQMLRLITKTFMHAFSLRQLTLTPPSRREAPLPRNFVTMILKFPPMGLD
ncbi:MAG: hypothetical protein ATN31_11185 [Candidatus Epulonipiscioides saccharophilum]|nr:MAG: hypothetical protein ATN31_11185 [Epulopiscium sp. AS2M-Bin001]